ncbi:Flp pilus assembly complex ATPase component TadA [Candidatus Bipolaricaulota bacterium]|nr:Flp pilus assembly complex ATPase component TadA [Candidatus Bipolaricaulota bacterium]MBS3813760.1 Flp pilus assembly complex ATPase component TadA [Candidatus Bipolaricaulota bacterium]MBS3825015.1 Flp pilus assembly complex ATPase component TadA [Candidatus Bipolaricaulota bacterium]
MKEEAKKYVPDTSVIVDGRVTDLLTEEKIERAEIIVPEAVVAELEAQASKGKETGYKGLNELQRLRKQCEKEEIKIEYKGRRPDKSEVDMAGSGEIDAMIRDLADTEGATLITNDRIQATVAESKGLPVILDEPKEEDATLSFSRLGLLEYFDDRTMSVHLRADTIPKAKKGEPGRMNLEPVGSEKVSSKKLERFAEEIVEVADTHPSGFIEMDSGGASVVQLGDLRIAIARPPFSDAVEITATRPVTKTVIEDYSYSDLLKERLSESHRGVVVSGAPGMGKSTLVQALSEFLRKSGWIVKTMEKPRDLDVSSEISQYRDLDGEMANTAEVLLLTRPDYTIFDEMRQTSDFEVFADLRMSGVGLVGVVHATKAIDSIQRLIGRVELGMIPQIVDTVVHVDGGDAKKVFDVELTVKTPSGMEQGDLARPVIEVRDFDSGKLAYEMYTFGEQVVVMGVKDSVEKPIWSLARKELNYYLSKEFNFDFDLEIKSDSRIAIYVADNHVPVVLGRGGKKIDSLEDELGLSIDVRNFQERSSSSEENKFSLKKTEDYLIMNFDPSLRGEEIDIWMEGRKVFSGAVSKRGRIKLDRGTKQAKKIEQARNNGVEITISSG